ncbi:MAG: molybdopterin-dependent oxidoreductase [Alphaproteobacteria bacterium]|nr:molybdopterin-dependent oxidoreductase [Alphaproteobacteria bacterium]
MQLDRRQFTAAALAGAFSLGWRFPAQAQAPGAPATGAEIGIWAVVHPDDSIVVRIARSEMGQGTSTGLAQLVADEMDADWKFVRLEFVAPHDNLARKRAWGDMSTGGSRGLRGSVDYVRKGGAVARAMLVQAAAVRWGVPAADCGASASVITHTPSGRTLRYGEVAAAAAKLPVPAEVTLKTPAQWTIIGKSVKRLDTLPKVSGKLQYALDVTMPGMLNAAIAQSPVFGGKLVSFDGKAIAGMSGVRHVLAIGDNAVAVVADKFYQAKTALAKLPVVWDERGNGNVDSAAIAMFVAEGLSAAQAGTGLKQGDAARAIAGATRKIESVYGTPFLAHATMEPMNCTALYTGDAVEVWAATQNGEGTLAAASEAAGVPLAKVKVHKTTLGGGFGRRGNQDSTRYAVLLAKQIPGVPVKLIWTREEDTQHDFYRPITQCRLTAGLDAAGNLTGFHMRISGQSIMAFASPATLENGVDPRMFQSANAEEFGYHAIPDLLIEHAMRNTHVPVGPWRGVNTNQNAVYIECFIDELAHAAGKDPVAFRRPLLAKNPKNLAVLEAVAAKAGWGTKLPPGVFRGIAQNHGYGSYVACVAEVSVSAKGELKIHRMVAGTNPGHAVNPQLIDAQIDGSFVYGLSALLYSEITIAKGRVTEGNFDTYQVARMADMPKVETVVVPTGDFWGGVGEPTIAVAAPAVLNAIFAATGRRIRHLPLKDQDLRPA